MDGSAAPDAAPARDKPAANPSTANPSTANKAASRTTGAGKPAARTPPGRGLAAGSTQPSRNPGRPPGSAPGRGRPVAGHDPDGPEPPRPATRPALVRPATLFALTGVMLTLLLGPYVRAWYVQRSQIAEQVAANQALRQQVDQLTAERQRWDDPAFVRTQARARLNYVLPGETGYVVLDDRPDAAAADPGHQAEKVADPSRPWFGDLWESVRLADRPAPAAKP